MLWLIKGCHAKDDDDDDDSDACFLGNDFTYSDFVSDAYKGQYDYNSSVVYFSL
jgi:hypothetical protein